MNSLTPQQIANLIVYHAEQMQKLGMQFNSLVPFLRQDEDAEIFWSYDSELVEKIGTFLEGLEAIEWSIELP